ncbi:MAG TPA: hypothetical protein VMU68_10850 [Acidimicrobiales bacterium]|nr:hypothetical protein [Acidimicrobiales bacterium]
MKSRRTALLAVPLIMVLLALPAGATSAAPQWHAAKVVSLPSGATGLPNGSLPALSCPSAGNCEAGGSYLDSKGRVEGLVLNEVKTAWKAPTRLIPPSDADANPEVAINSLSCATAGNCSAAGSFNDTKSHGQSFVANEVNGAWKQALEVNLPPNAGTSLQNSQIHSVMCWSPGNCSAIGTYFDNTEPMAYARGLEVNEVRGVWGQARETLLPSAANIDPLVNINQVACARAGNCVAVGSYITKQNATDALMIPEVNGAWKRAIALVLPGDASVYPSAALSEVTCVSAGNCTAIGTYTDVAGDSEGMIAAETHGTWARALAMVMPSGAAANPRTFFFGYGGLDCASIGNCSAGGQYLVGTSTYEGFLINEVHGTWHTATDMRLPSGALMAGRNGGVVAVSCRSAGNCSAGAAYVDGANSYQALVVNEVAGRWRTGQKITLPTGNNTVGIDGGVYGLNCHVTGPCTATGSFLKTPTNYEGFTVTTS